MIKPKQVFRFLYAIWLKSKDLSPTYLKATQPPSILRQAPSNHLVHVGVQDCKVSMYVSTFLGKKYFSPT